MEARRGLTDAEKSRITAEFITPYVTQPNPIMNIDKFMDVLQSSYGATHRKDEPLDQRYESSFFSKKKYPLANSLYSLYLDDATQNKEFPGVSAAAIQTYIREYLYNLNFPQACKEFSIESVRESMLNKAIPLYYAVAHPVKVTPEAGGFREQMAKFGKAKTRGLLESYYSHPEITNISIYSSFYQAFEASMLSFRYARNDAYVNSIWVVAYTGDVQWQNSEDTISRERWGSSYANNERAVRLEFAEVDRTELVPLRGFALGMESDFTHTWVLGKVDRGMIVQYAENPNTFKAKEETAKGCCLS